MLVIGLLNSFLGSVEKSVYIDDIEEVDKLLLDLNDKSVGIVERNIIYKGNKLSGDSIGNIIKIYSDEDILRYFEDIIPTQSVNKLREINIVMKSMKNPVRVYDNIIFKY